MRGFADFYNSIMCHQKSFFFPCMFPSVLDSNYLPLVYQPHWLLGAQHNALLIPGSRNNNATIPWFPENEHTDTWGPRTITHWHLGFWNNDTLPHGVPEKILIDPCGPRTMTYWYFESQNNVILAMECQNNYTLTFRGPHSTGLASLLVLTFPHWHL